MSKNAETKSIAFDDVVRSFYGCTSGNIDSPVWICGLEWGGGLSIEAPTPIEAFTPYGFEELQCLDTKDFECSFWASRSPFCQAVIKILSVLLKEELLSWKGFSDLEREGIAGRDGIALILNANPISFASRDEAKRKWGNFKIRLTNCEVFNLQTWTHCESFDQYIETVREIRRALFEKERKKRKPRIIVACGDAGKYFLGPDLLSKEQLRDFQEVKKLFPLSMRISSQEDKQDVWCTWLKNSEEEQEDTLLVWQNFPGRSFNRNSQFELTYREVRKLYKDKMECEWFKGFSNKESASLSRDEKLIESIRSLEEVRNEIEKYKRQCSGLLSTLEKLEQFNTKDPEILSEVSQLALCKKERLLEIYPLFDKQHQLLIEKIKGLRKTFREQSGKENSS